MRTLELVEHVSVEEIIKEYKGNVFRMKNSPLYFPGHSQHLSLDLRAPKINKKVTTLKEFYEKIVRNELVTQDTPSTGCYPLLLSLLHAFAKRKNGYLSRALLTSIKNEIPGKDYFHTDVGYFYPFHDRYHLVIFSNGSEMTVREITKQFVTGDIFFLNNKLRHNGGHSKEGEERIHVFFDVLPKNPFILIYMYLQWLFVYGFTDKQNYSFFKRLVGIMYLLMALRISLFTYSKGT